MGRYSRRRKWPFLANPNGLSSGRTQPGLAILLAMVGKNTVFLTCRKISCFSTWRPDFSSKIVVLWVDSRDRKNGHFWPTQMVWVLEGLNLVWPYFWPCPVKHCFFRHVENIVFSRKIPDFRRFRLKIAILWVDTRDRKNGHFWPTQMVWVL